MIIKFVFPTLASQPASQPLAPRIKIMFHLLLVGNERKPEHDVSKSKDRTDPWYTCPGSTGKTWRLSGKPYFAPPVTENDGFESNTFFCSRAPDQKGDWPCPALSLAELSALNCPIHHQLVACIHTTIQQIKYDMKVHELLFAWLWCVLSLLETNILRCRKISFYLPSRFVVWSMRSLCNPLSCESSSSSPPRCAHAS